MVKKFQACAGCRGGVSPPEGQGCLTQMMFSKFRLENTHLAGRRRGEVFCTECLCSGTARHSFVWEILRVKQLYLVGCKKGMLANVS